MYSVITDIRLIEFPINPILLFGYNKLFTYQIKEKHEIEKVNPLNGVNYLC